MKIMAPKQRITPASITKLKENEIFVFGSNLLGNHIGGAAYTALQWGAINGSANSMQGNTYAIPTVGRDMKPLSIEEIKPYIHQFILYVKNTPDKHFLLTEIGCGIAGHKPEEIASLLPAAISMENISMPEKFWNALTPRQTIKGYKVTLPNGSSKHGTTKIFYEAGKEYKHDGPIKICGAGFHFCIKASHCFSFYEFDSKNKVFEVEALGICETHDEDSKVCTDHLRVIRELSWPEVLQVANEGSNNTGYRNTGDWNTGDRNTGYRNTGDRNTGDRNTGYSNTGDWNTGDRNTGYRNTGDRNTGGWNTGDRNTGYRNTGGWNTGYRNTGYRNTGDWNTGDRNTGDWNTGDWNTGDRNTGYSNTGDRNTGGFCTGAAPFPMFNKKSSWTEQDFLNSKAYSLLSLNVDTKMWVQVSQMTEEEKIAHPSHKTADGYLKDIPFKEAFQNAWHNWDSESRKAFTSLPNFDAKIFKEITGVDVKAK